MTSRATWGMVALAISGYGAACGDNNKHTPTDGPQSFGDAPVSADACAATVCGGTCVDPMTDPNNCGACGHVCGCGETSCTAGVCDAAVLAGSQNAPVVVAAIGSNLYWGDDGLISSGVQPAVMTAPLGGGSASVQFLGLTAVRGIVGDDTYLYLTRAVFNVVEIGAIAGHNVVNMTNTQEPSAFGMVRDAANVYWVDRGSGLVRTAPLGSSNITGTTLAPAQSSPTGIAVDDTYVYWTNNVAGGSVMKVAKGGGTATPVATAQATPGPIVIDAAGNLYWANAGSGSGGSIQRLGTDGTQTQIASGAPFTLAVDANDLYWTDLSAGTVNRWPLSGSAAPSVVATGENEPAGLAVTATCLYFADYAAGAVGSGSVKSHDLE